MLAAFACSGFEASGAFFLGLKLGHANNGSDFESTDYGLTYFGESKFFENSIACLALLHGLEMSRPQESRRPAGRHLQLQRALVRTPVPGTCAGARVQHPKVGEDPTSSNEASEEKLNVATACACLMPENGPTTRELLKMARDARLEVHVSWKSSEHTREVVHTSSPFFRYFLFQDYIIVCDAVGLQIVRPLRSGISRNVK
ncbi:hypothetical protein MLD38_017591 [Melastoma candidum]|uniref:Uncharacterized protein n=1 Tax=Melastoma candidum TaxID=119954 RepID=A0ACB9QR36_9MYRT|nr:hypothetical protein MLD38_017591 [Melastoma candidum]